ncbi:MAG: RHO alpha subunit C-terminal catalytic domain-containing protein, partial [Hyphomicrobiaceae bacterium]
FSGQGTTVYDPRLDEGGRRFPTFADLPSKWNTAAEYVALYPNVLLGVHRDQTFAIVLEPVGVHRTIEHVGIYYAEPGVAENNWDDLRRKNAQQWRVIFEEDIFVVEGMQRGRQAPGFDGGKFSPAMDDPTHCFHHWVASQFET